jgi:hypothetical protein
MNISLFLTSVIATASIAVPTFAQSPAPAASSSPAAAPAAGAPGQMSKADMDKMMGQMMELAKLNENHKLLEGLVGSWTGNIKMWMNPDPTAKPQESKGTSVTKSMMEGRFFVTDATGKMQMPGPDGKMKEMTFKGMGTDGYDNVKKKFVGSWVDNMGTGIMFSEGTYDPATKTFTYTAEYEAMPGMKQKMREVLKMIDKDHHVFEWYEDRGGKEAKTMEISYTRAKK